MRPFEDRDLRARGVRVLLLVAVLMCTAAPIRQPAAQASALTLWYDRATAAFEEALPLGNGRLGAMVFGDAASERVMLNDSTLWAGGPINPEVNPEAITFLPKVREALFKGDYKLADQLTKKLQGKLLAVLRAARRPLHRRAAAGRGRHGGVPCGNSTSRRRQRGRRSPRAPCPSRATTSSRIPTASW